MFIASLGGLLEQFITDGDGRRAGLAIAKADAREAMALYQQGLISFLDVVDAQRTLADACQALASERTQYATQIAALFEVLSAMD